MIFAWLNNRRRRKLLAEPFTPAWLRYLEANLWQYARLQEAQRRKLHDLVKVFVAEKNWEGCGGLEMNDEVRVTIAAQACLMALGVEPNYYFERVLTILVYPDAYLKLQRENIGPVVSERHATMEGEHWYRGPIILSWSSVLEGGRNPRDGHNLVVHEFAHFLDSLEGDFDGVPPLANHRESRNWKQLIDQEHRRLVRMAMDAQPTLLDAYGATNKAEFFAVSTESFFEQPWEMRQWHPELYDVMKRFYQQDPASSW